MAIATKYAGKYEFKGIPITGIFMEGTITSGTHGTDVFDTQGLITGPQCTLAAPVEKGNYVKLNVYAANEIRNTEGVPVFELCDADDDMAIGRVKGHPTWIGAAPAATVTITNTAQWLSALENKTYRWGSVELFALDVVDGNAGTATAAPIVAGNAVQPSAAGIATENWELSTDAAGGGLAIAANSSYDNTPASSDNAALAVGIALTAANANDEQILIALGVFPVLFDA